MYRLNYVIFSFAFLAALAPGQTPKLTTIPLAFEPNHGQAPQAIDFTSHGFGYALSLTPDSAWLQLFSGTKNTPAANAASVRLRLVGADATAHGEALDRQSGISNYFLGNDPNRWRTDVPQFGRVEFHDVYPGIDLTYYGNNRQLEYDFILQSGADPGAIRLAVDGADKVRIDQDGDLVLTIGSAEIREHTPLVYR